MAVRSGPVVGFVVVCLCCTTLLLFVCLFWATVVVVVCLRRGALGGRGLLFVWFGGVVVVCGWATSAGRVLLLSEPGPTALFVDDGRLLDVPYDDGSVVHDVRVSQCWLCMTARCMTMMMMSNAMAMAMMNV